MCGAPGTRRPRLAFRILRRKNWGSTNHLSDHSTADYDSLFMLPDSTGRQGAQSAPTTNYFFTRVAHGCLVCEPAAYNRPGDAASSTFLRRVFLRLRYVISPIMDTAWGIFPARGSLSRSRARFPAGIHIFLAYRAHLSRTTFRRPRSFEHWSASLHIRRSTE